MNPTRVAPTRVGPTPVGPARVGPTPVGPARVGPGRVGQEVEAAVGDDRSQPVQLSGILPAPGVPGADVTRRARGDHHPHTWPQPLLQRSPHGARQIRADQQVGGGQHGRVDGQHHHDPCQPSVADRDDVQRHHRLGLRPAAVGPDPPQVAAEGHPFARPFTVHSPVDGGANRLGDQVEPRFGGGPAPRHASRLRPRVRVGGRQPQLAPGRFPGPLGQVVVDADEIRDGQCEAALPVGPGDGTDLERIERPHRRPLPVEVAAHRRALGHGQPGAAVSHVHRPAHRVTVLIIES
ncbi:hypothetical protein [Nonomuraea dietziae]|uniref:hypothetical protein n=1 Tax=Nonomuraea dietziae TaxID=65515 RepID=UPI0031D181C6